MVRRGSREGPLSGLHPMVIVLALVMVGAFAAASATAAQEAPEARQTQYWFDYDPLRYLNDALDLRSEVGLRMNAEELGWTRATARIEFRERAGSIRFTGGLGTIYTANPGDRDRIELRPFQGAMARWPDGHTFRLDHYVRVEERFEWGASGGTDASARVRYRLRTEFGRAARRPGGSWRFLLHVESFTTFAGDAGQFDERGRFGIGIERSFNQKYRVRLDAIWQKSEDLFSRDNVVVSAHIGGWSWESLAKINGRIVEYVEEWLAEKEG